MENPHYDPLVFGDITLLDILACERGVQGESLDLAVSFHKRLMSMKERQAKHELFVLQAKLWELEQKLNTPINERIVLEQGWLNGPSYELAHLYVRMTERLKLQTAAFKEISDKHGHADELRAIVESMMPDVCKAVQAFVADGGRLDPEDRFPGFPRGFTYMNALELDGFITTLRELGHKYEDKLVERKQAREAEAERHQRLAVESARLEGMSRLRKAKLESVYADYDAMVKRIKDHPVLGRISASPPRFTIGHRDLQRFAFANDSEFETRLKDARQECVAATRALREPLRRVWQSAQSRGVTRLGFQEYLVQEGFGSLFTA